jgi:hypothetical protein
VISNPLAYPWLTLISGTGCLALFAPQTRPDSPTKKTLVFLVEVTNL